MALLQAENERVRSKVIFENNLDLEDYSDNLIEDAICVHAAYEYTASDNGNGGAIRQPCCNRARG